jgi:RsiW-degrading membrane proteinase PrsW (M82 family)
MTSAAITGSGASAPGGVDIKLILAGGACAALSIGLLLVHAEGWTPLPVALPLVAIPAAIALRSLLVITGRGASASRRARVQLVVSCVGLAVSMGALALALPRLLQPGGPGFFVSNVVGSTWTIAVFTAAFLFTRTLTWRSLAGAFFTGFFGVTFLAVAVGTPIHNALGDTSALAVAVWGPLTEELLKALPVLVFVLMAQRNRGRRPSVGDVVLFGAVVGAGFALYEDAVYGRDAGAQWGDTPPLTFLFPSMHSASGGGISALNPGHIALTALVSFGLGFGILYRRRFRAAIWAIPITLAIAVCAHSTPNALTLINPGDHAPAWAQIVSVITVMGYLVPIAMIAGVAWITFFETRGIRRDAANQPRRAGSWLAKLLIPAAESARRSTTLAALQTAPPGTAESAIPAPPLVGLVAPVGEAP